MNDLPYTTADENPFNVQPIVQPSTLLDKWIMEQQQNPTKHHHTNASASFSNPYLAYPDLPRLKLFDITDKDDGASIVSYDLIDDSDIPANVAPQDAAPQDPSIPPPVRTTKNLRHSLAPAFRNINLPFLSPTSSNTDASSSRTFSRLSIFQRTPRSSISSNNDSHDHSKSSTHHRSISQQSANSNLNLYSPRATSRWRPSVLGHFYHPSASQSSVIVSETPSRPSISSADTSSTSQTATTVESNVLSTPPKITQINSTGSRKTLSSPILNFPTASGSSIRLPGHGLDSSSRGTHYQMLSQHQTAFTPELDGNVVDDDDDIDPLPTFCAGHHDTIRPSVPYSSSGSLSRVKFSSLNTRSQRKKKTLVISGIGVGEVRKFEGIKRWCESFGEVRQITRVPNGDLHINFRDSEVADTVCRVRAKVHIAGVGSVQLSWFVGQKR